MENDAANSNSKPPQNSVTLKKVQSSMNSQSIGRSQRPKGKRVKLVFQIGSVLAVCLWMLYHAKQSRDTNYGVSVRNERGSGIVGRKVNVGSSSLVEQGGNGDVRGEGVNVYDGNVIQGKESEKKVELKYEEVNIGDDNSDVVRDSLQEGHSDLRVTMSDQEGGNATENTSRHEDNMSHMIAKQGHESDAHQEFSLENVVPNDSRQDHNLVVDEGIGFDDETGVPVDGNDTIESRATESDGDREYDLHEEMHDTNSSTQSETKPKNSK